MTTKSRFCVQWSFCRGGYLEDWSETNLPDIFGAYNTGVFLEAETPRDAAQQVEDKYDLEREWLAVNPAPRGPQTKQKIVDHNGVPIVRPSKEAILQVFREPVILVRAIDKGRYEYAGVSSTRPRLMLDQVGPFRAAKYELTIATLDRTENYSEKRRAQAINRFLSLFRTLPW